MAIPPVDFFRKDANIAFKELNTLAAFTLQVRVSPQQGERRSISLTPQPDQDMGLFFDRMTATSTTLEINRVKLSKQLLKLDIPLVITMDDKPNRVANLFPNMKGGFPAGNPPYDGTVVEKKIVASNSAWAVKIFSRSVPQRNFAVRWGFILSREHGFAFQMGDIYGAWYIYQRADLPASFKPIIENFQRGFSTVS